MSFDKDVHGNEMTGEAVDQSQATVSRRRRRARRPRASDDTDFHSHVRDAVKQARQYLLERQDDERGYWCGQVASDVYVTAEYLLLLHWLGLGDSDRAARLRAFLVDAFRHDIGGWSSGGPLYDINTSVLCYLALKLSGRAPNDSMMQVARETIRGAGGADIANGLTRFLLAIFGQCSFDRCPLLPPEFMFLPRWAPMNLYRWSRWARATMVPLSVLWAVRPTETAPPGCDIQELYLDPGDSKAFTTVESTDAGSLGARFWKFNAKIASAITRGVERSGIRPLRRPALRAAEQWMAERLDDRNGMVGSTTATILVAIAFRSLGHRPDCVPITTCLTAIETALSGSDEGVSPCQVVTQDTALAAQALTVGGLNPHGNHLRRALEWLLQGEASRTGDWSQLVRAEPGGWSREFPGHLYPHVTATARVLYALREPFANNPPSSLVTDDSMVAMIRANSMNLARRQVAVLDRVAAASRRARRWLLAMQNTDGGWPCADRQVVRAVLYSPRFSPRIPVHDFSTPDSTGIVLQALGSWEMGCGQSAIDRAVSYLRQKQCADGKWLAMHDLCDVRATVNSLLGLRAVGISSRDMTIHAAVRWLVAWQLEDGGWPESVRTDAIESGASQVHSVACPLQTALVVFALEQAGVGHDDVVRHGIDYLVGQQQPDGCWQHESAGSALVECQSDLSYTALPLMALAGWGLQHPSDD